MNKRILYFFTCVLLYQYTSTGMTKPASLNFDEVTAGNNSSSESKMEINASRGQLLYENHCLACHESQVHIRDKRKARNIDGISYFVILRSSELKLGWSNEEVEAVTQYLNFKFYKYTE